MDGVSLGGDAGGEIRREEAYLVPVRDPRASQACSGAQCDALDLSPVLGLQPPVRMALTFALCAFPVPVFGYSTGSADSEDTWGESAEDSPERGNWAAPISTLVELNQLEKRQTRRGPRPARGPSRDVTECQGCGQVPLAHVGLGESL